MRKANEIDFIVVTTNGTAIGHLETFVHELLKHRGPSRQVFLSSHGLSSTTLWGKALRDANSEA